MHMAQAGSIAAWIGTAARLLKPEGTLSLIYRADSRDEVLAALAGKFVSVDVLPVYPKPGAPAIRIILQAVRGERVRNEKAVVKTSAGLFLNGADGRPSAEAEAILRNAAALPVKV